MSVFTTDITVHTVHTGGSTAGRTDSGGEGEGDGEGRWKGAVKKRTKTV